jgi:hypothetical protein
MSTDDFITRLKQDIQTSCIQKYGNVLFDWKELTQENDNAAHVHFAIFDDHGYIVGHYGRAYYEGATVRLKTMKA